MARPGPHDDPAGEAGPDDTGVAAAGPRHDPVMTEEIVAALRPCLSRPGAVLVDATVGLAGHATRLLGEFPQARLIGVDRDPRALVAARARMDAGGLGGRATLVEAVFDDLAAAGVPSRVDAILADLGVSSMQLDSDDRGFAYSRDTPLDMRMGAHGPTAADVLNSYPAHRLVAVLRDYGDERFARPIAAAVVAARTRSPLRTTGELVQIVYSAVPAAARRTGGHPAKRVFQALRIEVNDELGALRRALGQWPDHLVTGGRLAVLSYHSGEDRLVKRAFTALSTVDVPPGLPVEPEPAPFVLVGRAQSPGEAEVAVNPRAASARLRVLERVAR